jgi:ferredoxin
MINLFDKNNVFSKAFGSGLNSEIRNNNQVEDFFLRTAWEDVLPEAAGACPAMCINASDPESASVKDNDPDEPYIELLGDEGKAEIRVENLPANTQCRIFLLGKKVVERLRKRISGGENISTKEVVRELFCITEEKTRDDFLKVTTISSLPYLDDETDEFGDLKTASNKKPDGFAWSNAFVAVYYNGK